MKQILINIILKIPRLRLLTISVVLFALFVRCGDDELKLLPNKPNTGSTTNTNIKGKDCLLKKSTHSQVFFYDFTYNSKKQLTEIDGFPDFDLIEYKGDLPVKVINSLDKSYHIDFGYNAQNILTSIIFYGKDALGFPFEFKSAVFVNAQKQIYKVDLALPVFSEIIGTNISYDSKGNIIKITKTIKADTYTVLENLSFDTKKSPYQNAALGNIMIYFVLYTAVLGGENNTYFINQNNPLSSKVLNNLQEDISYTYQYQYNSDDFPIAIDIQKKVKKTNSTLSSSYKDTFQYECK